MIIFLLANIVAFSTTNAIAQEKNKLQDNERSNHVQEEIKPHNHDHSGHSINEDIGPAVDHEAKHAERRHGMDHSHDHSIDHSTHGVQSAEPDDLHHHHAEGHGMDHSHDHSIDHSTHGIQSTEHGDLGHHHHMDHDHLMDHEGTMIMGQNLDKLPSSCKSISEEIEITVHAGRKYAAKFPGTMFAFDQQQWNVKPCAKITWHFVNEDNVRHQFMMHGLPKYLYKLGMFHLEVTGPKTVSGTMIVPGTDDTLLIHCDMSHHMEKGMKAQLVIGRGGENIPSIPGLTPYILNDTYRTEDLPEVSDKSSQNSIMKYVTLNKRDLQKYGVILLGIFIGILSIPAFKRINFQKKNT